MTVNSCEMSCKPASQQSNHYKLISAYKFILCYMYDAQTFDHYIFATCLLESVVSMTDNVVLRHMLYNAMCH